MSIHNFSWVIADKLAGSALPGGMHSNRVEYIISDLEEYYERGVRCLVSLESVNSSISLLCEKTGLVWIYFPVDNFNIPHDREAFSRLVDSLIDYIENERPVCVHCYAGIGRTGLVLSCIVGKYLLLDAGNAIKTVRKFRPALDTDVQEQFVYDFLNQSI
ncbi:hypothetical protein ES703_94131 [subsurface metagenome]